MQRTKSSTTAGVRRSKSSSTAGVRRSKSQAHFSRYSGQVAIRWQCSMTAASSSALCRAGPSSSLFSAGAAGAVRLAFRRLARSWLGALALEGLAGAAGAAG